MYRVANIRKSFEGLKGCLYHRLKVYTQMRNQSISDNGRREASVVVIMLMVLHTCQTARINHGS